MKTPLRIKIVTGIAMVTMGLLCAVAVKALLMSPAVITNTERIILPNDSLIVLREQLADSRARVDVLQATADAQLAAIRELTGPLQGISDSLGVVQRVVEAGSWAQRLTSEREHADRVAQHQALQESAERMDQLQQAMPDYFTQLEQNISAIMSRPPDTVRIEQPRRRSFFGRLFTRS